MILYSFENSSSFGQKFKNLIKAFAYFVELVEMTPLIYNTLQFELFDQYSHLAILLNIFQFLSEIFGFWPKILKTNLKFDKSFFISL